MAITREERPKGTNHSSVSRDYLMRECHLKSFLSPRNVPSLDNEMICHGIENE